MWVVKRLYFRLTRLGARAFILSHQPSGISPRHYHGGSFQPHWPLLRAQSLLTAHGLATVLRMDRTKISFTTSAFQICVSATQMQIQIKHMGWERDTLKPSTALYHWDSQSPNTLSAMPGASGFTPLFSQELLGCPTDIFFLFSKSTESWATEFFFKTLHTCPLSKVFTLYHQPHPEPFTGGVFTMPSALHWVTSDRHTTTEC